MFVRHLLAIVKQGCGKPNSEPSSILQKGGSLADGKSSLDINGRGPFSVLFVHASMGAKGVAWLPAKPATGRKSLTLPPLESSLPSLPQTNQTRARLRGRYRCSLYCGCGMRVNSRAPAICGHLRRKSWLARCRSVRPSSKGSFLQMPAHGQLTGEHNSQADGKDMSGTDPNAGGILDRHRPGATRPSR